MRLLWNEATPTYYHQKFNLDVKLDESYLELSVFHFTDNLCGKLMYIDMSKEEVDTKKYNEMYGPNKFETILNKYYPDDGTIIKAKEWKYGDLYCVCNKYYGTHSQYITNNDGKIIISLCNRCNSPYEH